TSRSGACAPRQNVVESAEYHLPIASLIITAVPAITKACCNFRYVSTIFEIRVVPDRGDHAQHGHRRPPSKRVADRGPALEQELTNRAERRTARTRRRNRCGLCRGGAPYPRQAGEGWPQDLQRELQVLL